MHCWTKLSVKNHSQTFCEDTSCDFGSISHNVDVYYMSLRNAMIFQTQCIPKVVHPIRGFG
eukprot:1085819-Amphidinium_carterae.1